MSGILQESFPSSSVLVLCLCAHSMLHIVHKLPKRLVPEGEGAAVNTAGWVQPACPCPQVNLKKGVPPDSHNETCTAGAGSLLVEFGILSRLLGDSTFEWVARRAVKALWSLRSNNTGLLGNVWVLLCQSASVCAIRPQVPHVPSPLSFCSLCSCSVTFSLSTQGMCWTNGTLVLSEKNGVSESLLGAQVFNSNFSQNWGMERKALICVPINIIQIGRWLKVLKITACVWVFLRWMHHCNTSSDVNLWFFLLGNFWMCNIPKSWLDCFSLIYSATSD